jgi:hypothetical protein
MIEELCLGSITSGIVGIRGVRVVGGVERVRGEGEIGVGRDSGGSGRGMVVEWGTAETG